MSFDVLSYITNFKKSKKDINNTEEFSNKYNKSRNNSINNRILIRDLKD